MEIYETIKNKKILYALDVKKYLKYIAKWREGEKDQYSIFIKLPFLQKWRGEK